VQPDLPEWPDPLVRLEQLAPLVLPARLERWAQPVSRVPRDPSALPAQQGLLVLQAQLAPPDRLALQVRPVRQAPQDLRAPLVCPAQPEPRERPALPERREQPVLLDQQDHPAQPGQPDPLDHKALQ
jgi:hypothetical protein